MISAFRLVKHWMNIIGHISDKPVTYNDDRGKLFYNLIEEEFKELREALFDEDGNWDTLDTPEGKRVLVDALGGLIVVVNNYLVALHIDGDELAQVIHDSNMSKFCHGMKEVLDTFDKYNKLGIECDNRQVSMDNQDAFWIITRKSDGKILKGINFKEPNLERFL